VCISLCTTAVYNTAQNSSNDLPSYPPDNHHCSGIVYWREDVLNVIMMQQIVCRLNVLLDVHRQRHSINHQKQLIRSQYRQSGSVSGDGGGGNCLVRMEWRPAGWTVCLPLLIFPCTRKSRSSLLVPTHPGGPRKRAVKRLWLCVCGTDSQVLMHTRTYTLT